MFVFISKKDFEEISTKNRRSGMFLLLMRLPLHTNYWFPDFIAALNNGDTKAYKILASDIEPAIAKGICLYLTAFCGVHCHSASRYL